jgi:hypothetical protein
VARILIVGGGCRGRRLASLLGGGERSRPGDPADTGHAVRIVTRTESTRPLIEAAGAECLIGDPDRLATLRGALDGVTVACWLLATARGDAERVRELHGSRLRAFLAQAIDTPMRGFVYEAPAAAPGAGVGAGADALAIQARSAAGEPIVRELAARNAIPAAFIRADPGNPDAWLAQARAAIDGLLDAGSR